MHFVCQGNADEIFFVNVNNHCQRLFGKDILVNNLLCLKVECKLFVYATRDKKKGR